MLTTLVETEGERVLTVELDGAVVDLDTVSELGAVLDDVETGGVDVFVVEFRTGPGSIAGDFASFGFEAGRQDIRFFARWDETLSRISRLKAKTFVVYDGRVGLAAVHLGCVVDLRLSSAHARLVLASLAEGRFPGMAAYWLPKFVGLGVARRMFLLGEDLRAARAIEVGLVDVVGAGADAVVAEALKSTRSVTPEAAYFTRRILDDCYLLEPPAAVEQIKAARFKLGMSATRSAS